MANTKITNPELFNLGDSTSTTQLPVMTTTQRIAMNAPPTLNIDYLVVAGGGGGASGYGASGAGGGAGEFLYKTAQTLTFGGSGYTVTVGVGGIGGQVTNSTVGSAGAQGGDSVFIQTTKGGGFGRPAGGSPAGVYVGSDGGSGGGGTFNGAGGASIATSPGLGFAGGAGYSTTNYGSGGGGGAGSAGINGTSTSGGNGGAGVQNSITGVSPAPYYAAGGGAGLFDLTSVTGIGGSGIGGSSYYNQNATDGAANTGSGGGGACNYLGNVYQGGDGGSGVIILRYTTADVASYTATGLTPTEDTTTIPGQTILSFTTVGTGTITFTSLTPTGTISTGEMIFNSTTDKVEYFDGTKWYGITYAAPPLYPPFTLKFTVGSVNSRNVSSYIRHTTTANQGTAFYKGGTQSAAATSTTKGNVNSGTYSDFTGAQEGLLYHRQAWNGTGTQILGGSAFGNNIYVWDIADWDDRVIENGTLISTFYNHKNITVDREGKTALMVNPTYTSWQVFSFATPQDFTSAITLEASYTASNNSNLYTSSNTSGTGYIQFLGDNGLYVAFGFAATGQYKIYSINPSNPFSLNSSDHTLQGTITFTTSVPTNYMSIDPSMDAIAWAGSTAASTTFKSVPLT